jgi:uncharacterized integral membrane protein (TIGR00698 family)
MKKKLSEVEAKCPMATKIPPRVRTAVIREMDKNILIKGLFLLLVGLCLCPAVNTPAALAAGILFSLLFGNPWPEITTAWSKKLLQWSVVGLGFGLSLGEVWLAGKDAILYTMVGICLTLFMGRLLGSWFGASRNTAALIAFGTAICGGSAIAAMAPVLKSEDEETAVAMATVFTLNAAALLIFPVIGHLLHLSQRGFGLWAALAIHDTSSVVGAAAAYGTGALAVGTTVKLARAVWIMPCALGASWLKKSEGKVRFPLFILGFLVAAGLRSLLPHLDPVWLGASALARQGLVITLFLIGAGLTREVLRKVGIRPFAQGVTLWALVSVATLAAILQGWIR